MLTPTGNGTATTQDREQAENITEETSDRGAFNGEAAPPQPADRLASVYQWTPTDSEPTLMDGRPVLAMLCYEDPTSPVGQFVSNLAGALAQRKVAVHLFARKPFDTPGVLVHNLGDSGGDYLPHQIEEFTQRASNAFLQHFPAANGSVTLMGFEWTTIQALSLLHSIKRTETILSLHSLERQRSGLGDEASKRIDELEQYGLREAKTILLHDAAAGEVATACVPECAERIVYARERFPVESFGGAIDPGAIKARYQVGPTDPTILYVGDLDERYGPDLLIKAMPAVLRNHSQARLIVVGAGAWYWRLRVFTRYMLLEHAVRFPGNVEGQAMCELVQAADLIALPSREATPWWPFQAAWAARRPVVATHNAAPAMLEHETNSVLVYPSENSLVWGIERVLYDPKLARTIGEQGYAKLEAHFGWNVLASQVQELITAKQPR